MLRKRACIRASPVKLGVILISCRPHFSIPGCVRANLEGFAILSLKETVPLTAVTIPTDLPRVLDEAWAETQNVPGHLEENEARFLGMLAACVPARGAIVEIGSFKGKSTVMLAKVASHYDLGPVTAID